MLCQMLGNKSFIHQLTQVMEAAITVTAPAVDIAPEVVEEDTVTDIHQEAILMD